MFLAVILIQTDLYPNPLPFENPAQDESEKKEKKKKDSFKIYGGLTFNKLNLPEEVYQSNSELGWMAGFSYLRGRFFYWEAGARYNRSVYDLTLKNEPDTANPDNRNFSVSFIDVPISGGINLTSFVSRIIGVRIFLSLIPSFAVGVGGNDMNLTRDNINTFIFRGQAGLGLDIAFIFLEGGYNYSFNDLLKNDVQSNPSQFFVALGFRF
jgi:hypothetical protein